MRTTKVEICGVNTSKLPVLTNEEMQKLFIKIKKGDLEARQEFIQGNLRLVLSIIQRFNRRGEDVDDLFQIGCIGLIKSIDNFDLSHNVRFSTYAVPMIIGEIRRYLRDNNSIRVSRSLRDIAYKALQAREELIYKNSKEPNIMEIAAVLGIPKEDIVFALEAIQEPISLFEPVFHDSGDPIFVMEQIKDEKEEDRFWVRDIGIKQALEKLNKRDKEILDLRIFQGRTQMELAHEMGL